jgi:polar amino acid transport system permease protein
MNWDYVASLNWALAWEFRQALYQGLLMTLTFFFLGGALGTTLALVLSVCLRSTLVPLRWVAVAFIETFRNTPLLVQLVWIHFALPAFSGIRTDVFESGLIALTFNVGSYVAEIIRAGIEAIPKGQWEGAHSLGLGGYPTWRYVILPQAVRMMLPALANITISLLKGTSILSIISIAELMRATTRISTHTARPVEMFTIAAVIYFIFGILIVRAFAWLERRYELRTS